MPDATATAFLDAARAYLLGDYLPKIERAFSVLSEADVWWRPNPASNSVGNLVLHLSGNVRQWLIHGVGGAPDVRQRAAEFRADGGYTKAVLLDLLRHTLTEADAVIAATDPATLHEARVIQGMNTTLFGAIFRAVEHFSGHVGQILYIAKLRTGQDLNLYSVSEDGTARKNW